MKLKIQFQINYYQDLDQEQQCCSLVGKEEDFSDFAQNFRLMNGELHRSIVSEFFWK